VSAIKITPADRKLSLEVRERDEWTCQRCGRVYVPPTSGLHAAHYFSRGIPATRLDPVNLLSLCNGCHRWLAAHREEHASLMVRKFGVREFEELCKRAKGYRDRKKRTA
jgi:5-methylcytosine-specific restriction endonuclease McrA